MSAAVKPLDASPRLQPLAVGNVQRTLILDDNGPVALGTFLAQVRAVAAALPSGRHAVNLCEDRYRFLVAFCAVALRGQTTLLPPSRAPVVVADVLAQYEDSYCLGDAPLPVEPPRYWQLPATLPEQGGDMPRIVDEAMDTVPPGTVGRRRASSR